MTDTFVPHQACTVSSGGCFVAGQCLGQCKNDQPMTDTYTPVLTPGQIQTAWVEHGLDDESVEEFARAIERAAIEAYQRQQKENAESLFAAVRPYIATAAAAGQHVVDTPFGPAFLSLTADRPDVTDLPTATVDNPMENPMTDRRQPSVTWIFSGRVKE